MKSLHHLDTNSLIEKFSKYMRPTDIVDWEHVHEENGELICDVCGQPKVMRIEQPILVTRYGRMMRVECDCMRKAREDAEREAEITEKEEQERIAREVGIPSLKSASNIAERFKNVHFSDYSTSADPTAFMAVSKLMKWCKDPKGGVHIYGPSGLGKTMLISCMANSIIEERVEEVYFTDTYEILRDWYKPDFIEKISSVKYLFIDDIGSGTFERYSETQKLDDVMYLVVNERYKSGKPLITTSNYSFEDLARKGMRQATVDRLREMADTVITLKGNSFRNK